jgi:hypothetical protein
LSKRLFGKKNLQVPKLLIQTYSMVLPMLTVTELNSITLGRFRNTVNLLRFSTDVEWVHNFLCGPWSTLFCSDEILNRRKKV